MTDPSDLTELDVEIPIFGKCETLEKVAEFHQAFHAYTAEAPELPQLIEPEVAALNDIAAAMALIAQRCHQEAEATAGTSAQRAFLRLQLIQEELTELTESLASGDLHNAARELSDIQYVLDGTYLALGLRDLKLPVFRAVHRANMSKLGAGGQPIHNEAGRVVKGPDFVPPTEEIEKIFAHGGDLPEIY